MQFPKELQPSRSSPPPPAPTRLNEVQFPKELQRPLAEAVIDENGGLNEVQFPKELQLEWGHDFAFNTPIASMKCSSRRNCNLTLPTWGAPPCGLNEVQFPKELQPDPPYLGRAALWPQ